MDPLQCLCLGLFSFFCQVDPGHTLVFFIRLFIKKACLLQSLYGNIYRGRLDIQDLRKLPLT